jgi:hypothetical protein
MDPMKRILPILLFLASPAFAGDVDPFDGLTVSQTIKRVQVTHYSATERGQSPCKYECYTNKRTGRRTCVGGKDESPSGLSPVQYRLDHPKAYMGRPTVLAAVPQSGGSAGIKGCFFALPDAHPGVLFYGGDWYGSGSNNKLKIDVSSQCSTIVNETNYSKLIAYNCPGKKGGKAPPIPREPASEPPPKEEPPKPQPPAPAPAPQPSPPPPVDQGSGESCQWVAMLLCNTSSQETVNDQKYLGLSGTSIINSGDYSNLIGGWSCVVVPASSQADANAKVSQYRRRANGAYPKKICR